MGITFAKLFQRLFSKREMRILMVRARRARERRARSTRVARAGEIARWRDRDRGAATRATSRALCFERERMWNILFHSIARSAGASDVRRGVGRGEIYRWAARIDLAGALMGIRRECLTDATRDGGFAGRSRCRG